MRKSLWATLGVVIIVLALSGNALAGKTDNPTAQVVGSSVNAQIMGARANAKDIATGRITVLADMRVKPSVKLSSARCYWTKGGFWNSGSGANGKRYSFWDKIPAKLCPSKKSKTGWVKVAGGTSGRNCGNVASAKKPAFPVVRGKVVMVRSFAAVRVALKAQVAVRVTAICGWAEAHASSQAVVSLRQYLRGSGPVVSGLYAQLTGKATAQASAQLSCVTAPVPPPPPPSPPPPPPVTPPTVPPPPSCTVNCQPPPPPPPPGKVTVQGSTSVQTQKSLQQACPPPNSSIIKTGTSDSVTLNSPVFTGTGTTQAAAQADLDSKLAAWRAQNQGAVDSTASNQAQQRLGDALLTCPKPPPPNKPPTVSIVGPQHVFVGGVVTYCVSASDPDGDSLSYSFTTNYGSVAGSGNCYTYQAPMAPMNGVTVTVTVNDGKGGIASATTAAFPVIPDQF